MLIVVRKAKCYYFQYHVQNEATAVVKFVCGQNFMSGGYETRPANSDGVLFSHQVCRETDRKTVELL